MPTIKVGVSIKVNDLEEHEGRGGRECGSEMTGFGARDPRRDRLESGVGMRREIGHREDSMSSASRHGGKSYITDLQRLVIEALPR